MKKTILIAILFITPALLFGQTPPLVKSHAVKTTKISAHTMSVEETEQESVNEENNQTVSQKKSDNNASQATKEKQVSKELSSTTLAQVKNQLKEFFGEYYEEYGAPNLEFYAEFYARCVFVPLDEVNDTHLISNLSALDLKDKYNPEVIKHDFETFDPDTFNVFKYHLDYYNQTDVYYRVYDTDLVLKIHKH